MVLRRSARSGRPGTPSSLRATFAHVSLVAKDWRRLAAFYETVFGCVPVPPTRHLSGRWLDQGTGLRHARIVGGHLRLPGHGPRGPTLEIFQHAASTARRGTALSRPGLQHLAFAVADVPAALEAVLRAGGRAVGAVVSTTIRGAGRITFVYAADPEGNVLELQHWDRRGRI